MFIVIYVVALKIKKKIDLVSLTSQKVYFILVNPSVNRISDLLMLKSMKAQVLDIEQDFDF